jgi:hypothetical protein
VTTTGAGAAPRTAAESGTTRKGFEVPDDVSFILVGIRANAADVEA